MNTNNAFFSKIGLPQKIVWGYIGVLIFMMGDGLEIGWLSPWLVENGFTIQRNEPIICSLWDYCCHRGLV